MYHVCAPETLPSSCTKQCNRHRCNIIADVRRLDFLPTRFCQSRYPVAGEHRVLIRVRLAKRPVVSPYCCGLAERQRERLFGWRSPGATEAATAAERRHHHHCNDSSDTVRRAAQLYDCAEADGDAAAALNAVGACTLTVGRTQFTKINGSPWLPIVFDLKFSLTPDRLLSSHDRR